VGSSRTAEELGRAFPGVPVVVSGGEHGVVAGVDTARRLVVATPGAEPEAEGGYAAGLLLDAAVTSGRPELWASEEALRRWMTAAALVRGADDGGRVMVLGHGAPIPVQALVRWDPGGYAARELAERAELAFPPAATLASLEGAEGAVGAFLGHLVPPPGAEVLGPVPLSAGPGPPAGASIAAGVPGVVPDPATPARAGPDRAGTPPDPVVRALVRVPREATPALTRALAQAAAARSARKEPGSVRVQVDPRSLW
jgi:primosomal protein N' (replication factor Y)